VRPSDDLEGVLAEASDTTVRNSTSIPLNFGLMPPKG